MTPVAKGFLIGCSVLLVLGIVGVAGLVWFAKTKGEAIVKNAEQRQKDGKAFGKNVPESACATEAMTRYKKSPGILAGIEQHLWLAACLDTSAFEPAFCEGVPPESDITRTATWRVARCNELGVTGDSTCPNVVAAVQTYCLGDSRKKKAGGT